MEEPIQPEYGNSRGLAKTRLTIIYLAGFFISLILLITSYFSYAQLFVDLLTPAYGFDKAFDIVTWFTPLAWLIFANLAAIVVLFLATHIFPFKDNAKEILRGKFTRSMFMAVILCLISLVFLDVVVYMVNKEWKIIELVPLLLLGIWFYTNKYYRQR
ncbi:MAG: hypothetical protein WBZ29_14210 [Methanocella sp.]